MKGVYRSLVELNSIHVNTRHLVRQSFKVKLGLRGIERHRMGYRVKLGLKREAWDEI